MRPARLLDPHRRRESRAGSENGAGRGAPGRPGPCTTRRNTHATARVHLPSRPGVVYSEPFLTPIYSALPHIPGTLFMARLASDLYEPESAWYLLRVNLFAAFGPDAFAGAPGLRQIELDRRGDLLGLEGDPGELAYVVRSGRVSLGRLTEDHRRTALAVLTTGGPFGEAGLPGKSAPREHAIEALEPASVLVMPAETLRTLVARRPDYCLSITPKRGGTLSRPVASLLFKDVRTRVLEALADLAEAQGAAAGGGEVDLGIGAPELADLIGAGRQIVSTLVNELKHEGELGLAGGTIRVGDPDKLRLLI